MPRTVKLKLNGATFEMPATYRASREIAEQVGDPIRMAMDSAAGKLAWTQENVIDILFVGVKNAGCTLERDVVAEHIVDMGLAAAGKVAGDYVFALITGEPEKPVESSKKKPLRKVG